MGRNVALGDVVELVAVLDKVAVDVVGMLGGSEYGQGYVMAALQI